ncbi:Succinate-semialdehyde dehydrogenase [NADP(+)] GabD [BD1-7 clade bacterium]|uniref:Succinate-semialdehyde dehydrogenase [NADP(+)] GabD n=1 Tax=BD1-7 clade bacterium TaxID=2029982 RepID=A0A5S9NVV6_9GAMM|nr:Succinate-semialdehyde dehydrogenase [NADP(+)] GabD [BD1-7 clade bacterium]CAA0094841.1 Succinate-semialdehyde dehydrogenase [NADP(+)] GabD [BD1-7 clade bacterium]
MTNPSDIPTHTHHIQEINQRDNATFDVLSATNGQVIAKVGVSSTEHAEFALSQCDALFKNRDRWLSLEARVGILERMVGIMETRREELAKTIALEGGKPLSDANVEADRAIQGVRKSIEALSSEAGYVVPMGMYANSAKRMAFTQKEPIGVVLAISAFNHPLNLIVHQVGAAIAAGCPCIVKPAANTPLSCIAFYDIAIEAGLPNAWLHVVTAENHDVASLLVKDKRIGFLTFIGSARVGWMIKNQVHDGVRCALEHGGVAPVIVTNNANLTEASASITKGGYYHAGQVCVSTQRVFVDSQVAEAFIEQLTAHVKALTTGDASDPDTDVGPLIRPSEVNRVEEWVNEAIDAGAIVSTGGKRINDHFFEPTLLINPPAHVKVSTHEVFGPVVCIYTYNTIDQAIAQANSLDVAFQAAVFSNDINECLHCYRHLAASAVMVNDHSAFREDNMPFQGLRSSGLSTGGIKHTIEEMQIDKLMVIKSDSLL